MELQLNIAFLWLNSFFEVLQFLLLYHLSASIDIYFSLNFFESLEIIKYNPIRNMNLFPSPSSRTFCSYSAEKFVRNLIYKNYIPANGFVLASGTGNFTSSASALLLHSLYRTYSRTHFA